MMKFFFLFVSEFKVKPYNVEAGNTSTSMIAFKGHIHPIDPSWHMLGLGYQDKTEIENVKQAAVIHYNGQSKPWLEIECEHLRPLWTKYVNYSNDFIQSCHIMGS